MAQFQKFGGSVKSTGMPVILVAGAGSTECNGIYVEQYDYNGRPFYKLQGGRAYDAIYWATEAWTMSHEYFSEEMGWYYITVYYSFGDYATPDLVPSWSVSNGEAPAPTVSATTINYTDDYVYTADGDGGTKWAKFGDYLEYVAVLTQDGTETPPTELVVLKNTIPNGLTWTYDDPGYYSAHNDIFLLGKVFVSATPGLYYDSVLEELMFRSTSAWAPQAAKEAVEISLFLYDSEGALANGVDQIFVEVRVYLD